MAFLEVVRPAYGLNYRRFTDPRQVELLKDHANFGSDLVDVGVIGSDQVTIDGDRAGGGNFEVVDAAKDGALART